MAGSSPLQRPGPSSLQGGIFAEPRSLVRLWACPGLRSLNQGALGRTSKSDYIGPLRGRSGRVALLKEYRWNLRNPNFDPTLVSDPEPLNLNVASGSG